MTYTGVTKTDVHSPFVQSQKKTFISSIVRVMTQSFVSALGKLISAMATRGAENTPTVCIWMFIISPIN